jgi:hypothetical protein
MKIVRESISFQRGLDPKEVLKIGEYAIIEKWINEIRENGLIIQDYTITKDMMINAFYVDLSSPIYSVLPSFIKFGKIRGSFSCCFETKKSLRALPYYVGGSINFYFGYNKNRDFTKIYVERRCKAGKGVNLYNI